MRTARSIVLVLAVLCGVDAGRTPGSAQPPPTPFVVDGTSAPDEFSTVWIQTKTSSGTSTYLCSGTLIGTNRILTAGHCICAACTMTVGFGPRMNAAGDQILANVVGVSLHPLYQKSGPEMQPGFDLAVLSLDGYTSGPEYKKPIPVYPISLAVRTNELLIVGYGLTEMRTPSGSASFGEKRKATVRVSSATCTQPWAGRAGCVKFREFVLQSSATLLNNGLGPDTCNGDSGGPAFVVGKNNTRSLVGVTSRALVPKGGFSNQGCGFGGIYEYAGVPLVLSWLRNVVPDLQVAPQ